MYDNSEKSLPTEIKYTKTNQFINNAHALNKEFEEKIYQLDNIIGRLDGIANRLNGNEFPKNTPMTERGQTPDSANKITPKPSFSGIMAEFDNLIIIKNSIISNMQSKLNEASETISFIEDHI
jgi:hypothetical protein